jgi:hypothetical protein
MINTIKEAKRLTETMISHAGKGFWSFFRNAVLVLMVILIMFIGTHPEVILNPQEYLEKINSSIFIVVGILFLLITITYQLARSISDERDKKRRKGIADEVEAKRKKIKAEEEDRHAYLVNQRIEISPKIRSELKDLLIRLGATRASICEMHNGTNNLAGIPFLYLDMTYEEISPQVNYVIDDFKNFNLAKYPFIASHIKDTHWIGSIEELKKEDPYLASRIEINNTEYGAVMVLRSSNSSMIGLLIVTFNYNDEDLPSEDEIFGALASSAQIMSTLLDKASLMELSKFE